MMERHHKGLMFGGRSRVDPRLRTKKAARDKTSAKMRMPLMLVVNLLILFVGTLSTVAFYSKGAISVVQQYVNIINVTDHVQGMVRSVHIAINVTDPVQGMVRDVHIENPPVNCHKRILILADVAEVTQWTDLDIRYPPWNSLTQYPDENKLYRGLYECHTTRDLQGHTNNCTIELTFSSSINQMHGKDAVIFNVGPGAFYKNMNKLLNLNQSNDQLWLFYSVETPLMNQRMSKGTIAKFPVHGIWSYTLDSGIYSPYGSYQPGISSANSSKEMNHVMSGKSKTRLVAWISSNCHNTFWPRMKFIEDLQKYIQLDTYGRCGNLTCKRKSDQCSQLMSSYKFYLSIENAECKEYMTEKLWLNALQRGVVPIVYGAPRESYEKLTPPNSFIYAGDFKSVKSLADYIIELDKRPELYDKFFEWRGQGSMSRDTIFSINHTCDVLPFIEQLRDRKLEKKPISTYPWFQTCRIDSINYKHIPRSLEDWKPW